MLFNIIDFIYKVLHQVAPFGLIGTLVVLVWFIIVSRKWKDDTERYNRKY